MLVDAVDEGDTVDDGDEDDNGKDDNDDDNEEDREEDGVLSLVGAVAVAIAFSSFEAHSIGTFIPEGRTAWR